MKNLEHPEALKRRLKKSQLVGILMKIEGATLELEFTHGEGDEGVFLRCLNVIHFIFSKDLDDDDDCYFAGDVFIESLRDGGKKVLTRLHYGLRELDREETASYPSHSLFYVYIDGDVGLHVVCEQIQTSPSF